MKIIVTLLSISLITGCSSNTYKSENLSAIYIKGEEAYKKRDYKMARIHYESVIKAQPDNIDVLFRLANISMHLHKWKDSMRYYEMLLEIKPSHQKAHHNLAMLYLLQAKTHLYYYIANNQRFDNNNINELIISINNYSKPGQPRSDDLDQLADEVKSYPDY